MRTALWSLLLCSLALPVAGQTASFILGADVSFLEEVEAGDGVFTVDALPADPLDILASNGFGAIRLRVWHTPPDGRNTLEETLATAARAREAGLDLLLDLHYSDTWADPGKQFVPTAWAGQSFDALRDSVRAYTFSVVDALARQNTLPDIVQLGNEIICGMLWDAGRVCNAFNTGTQWEQLASLLSAAREGALEAVPAGDSLRIMIHIDRGADNAGSRWFFDQLMAEDIAFDLIGLSYYPWWHGSLDDLSRNLTDLAGRYGKDIVVVETGYPWTLAWNDTVNNLVGDPTQLLPGYPATVAGQEAFFRELHRRVKATPANRGIGVFLWEPLAISGPSFGSVMENLALFNFAGEVLASMRAFAPESTTGVTSESEPVAGAIDVYPTPFHTTVEIVYEGKNARGTLQPMHAHILDSLGRSVVSLGPGRSSGDGVRWQWDGQDGAGRRMPAGLYFCAIEAPEGSVFARIVRQ
ncbi:MAG: glycosyl hydrolase 53 family protein [Rhodothermales bacterium]|nr:glycosyl hydrolase 53 family protein [Rhodothermales bacterium]